nr:uncharacterized protein LOC110375054 [Helicoverpa armigera]
MDSSSAHSKHPQRPTPTDFDEFLPWACQQLSVETTVVVIRSLLKQYVSVIAERPKKEKKTKSRATSMASSSEDAISVVREATKSSINSEIPITIEAFYDSNGNLIQLQFMNNKPIPREVFKIIALVVPYHKLLRSITINSGLTMESIYEISKFINISHITEMVLDGTVLLEANYHILLDYSCLKYLSLSKCKINDTVVQTIASKIVYPYPASHKLSALNLATNRITDIGAKYLADALRTNRKLSYLNLADNMITDDGAISILNTLKSFVLTKQEVLDSKSRLLQYLKKKNGLIGAIAKELLKSDHDKKAVKKKVAKPLHTMLMRKNKQLEKELSKECHVVSSFEKPCGELRERAASLAECQIGFFSDPFSAEKIYTTGKTTFCYGNNGLCYLNIAYNDLTYATLKVLYEVVVTQRNMQRVPRGLINVVIEGNFMPIECEELQKIDEILSLALYYSLPRQSTVVKKRHSHSNIKTADKLN